MRVDLAIETAMGMTDDTWLRHANPWSVWSRLAAVPAFALAVWSRDWIGLWCLVPIALVVAFLWLNTRIFRAATDLDRWETSAILGEKIWLQRRQSPIPPHHRHATTLILAGSSAGIFPTGLGLVWLDACLTLIGVVAVTFGQIWFLDRLAWLYAESLSNTKYDRECEPGRTRDRAGCRAHTIPDRWRDGAGARMSGLSSLRLKNSKVLQVPMMKLFRSATKRAFGGRSVLPNSSVPFNLNEDVGLPPRPPEPSHWWRHI